MLSLKYIRIRKERPAEQRLSSIWCDACSDFGIPCVLIYLNGKHAYISASLKHLPARPTRAYFAQATQEKLHQVQQQYSPNAQGYWKHSDLYHTFDDIPDTAAQQAAAAIFEVLAAHLSQPAADNKIKGKDGFSAAEERPA